jgi:hypothetical protein
MLVLTRLVRPLRIVIISSFEQVLTPAGRVYQVVEKGERPGIRSAERLAVGVGKN